MAGLYSEVGHGATVLTVDYRVAPEHPFPAALDDAVTSYNWLLEQGYTEEQIVVAGDSAGGGLAMALCHRLKKLGEALGQFKKYSSEARMKPLRQFLCRWQ